MHGIFKNLPNERTNFGEDNPGISAEMERGGRGCECGEAWWYLRAIFRFRKSWVWMDVGLIA